MKGNAMKKKTTTKKTTKKSKNLLKKYKSNAQKHLDEFIELLKSSKDELSEDIRRDLEVLIKECELARNKPVANKKKPLTKQERLAKLKDMEKEMAIQDSPRYKYDEKHVKKLMRLLDVDRKTAKSMSATEKMRNNLHVPYVENAIDKTMAVELDIYNSCISQINNLNDESKFSFTMKKATRSINQGLKEIKKSNPKIIDGWKITSNTINGSDYIYVDVDYKTTLNTHRHIFKLNPMHYVDSAQFFDDTRAETIDDKPKTC